MNSILALDNNPQNLLILAVVAFTILVFVLFRYVSTKQRLNRVKHTLHQLDQASLARQENVLKELSFIGDLISDTSLSKSERIQKTKASFEVMDLNNIDGAFDEIIKVTKEYVENDTQEVEFSNHLSNDIKYKSEQVKDSKTRNILDSAVIEVSEIAEAEVYVAYGRKKQAIDLLEKALHKNPARKDIAEKLAELRR